MEDQVPADDSVVELTAEQLAEVSGGSNAGYMPMGN